MGNLGSSKTKAKSNGFHLRFKSRIFLPQKWLSTKYMIPQISFLPQMSAYYNNFKDYINDLLMHYTFIQSLYIYIYCTVGWGCWIHWLHLCRGVRPHPPISVLIYDTKQSDGEAPVMLELWGMWSTPSLSLLPGPLWPRMVATDRALSMG